MAKRAVFALAALLVVFVVLTRWEPSVLRAATMIGLVLAGRLAGIPVDPIVALGWGIAALLLFAGQLAGSVGFQLSVAATIGVAAAIISEAYISFLGLGVQPPTATWGNMLDGAYNYIDTAPWLWIFPGLLILLTVLSINFVGDGLRDALDPRSRPM